MHGAITQVSIGNDGDLAEATAFNPRLQVSSFTVTNPLSTLFGASYTYGVSATQNNGNLKSQTLSRTGASWTESFGYDGVNRLSSATESGVWAQTYEYDARGNRAVLAGSNIIASALTPQTTNTSVPFDANNHWTATGYDLSGNMTQMATSTYSFDAENRLISETGNGSTATYVYDGDGRRVMKTVDAATTVYVYDPSGRVAAEYASTPAEVYGTEYMSKDYLGNVRLITGATTACHDYLPFGEEIPSTWGRSSVACFEASDGITRRFTGKERDAESGLDYFGARYSSGAQGRFTSADGPFNDQEPSDPQSWNLYGYGRNNPLRNTDPTGGCSQAADGGYTDDGNGIFPGPCSNGTIGAPANSSNTLTVTATELPRTLAQLLGLDRDYNEAVFGKEVRFGEISIIPELGASGALLPEITTATEEASILAKFSGILRDAARSKGNTGIGTASEAEAAELGEAWVGQGSRVASDGKTLVSADGLRTYRPPSFKPNLDKVQANFEQKLFPGGQPYSNAHLDIR